MRATRIEIRTADPRAGRRVDGVWEPAGQLIATLWIEQPGEAMAEEIAGQIRTLAGEDVVATVHGREEIPAE